MEKTLDEITAFAVLRESPGNEILIVQSKFFLREDLTGREPGEIQALTYKAWNLKGSLGTSALGGAEVPGDPFF